MKTSKSIAISITFVVFLLLLFFLYTKQQNESEEDYVPIQILSSDRHPQNNR